MLLAYVDESYTKERYYMAAPPRNALVGTGMSSETLRRAIFERTWPRWTSPSSR